MLGAPIIHVSTFSTTALESTDGISDGAFSMSTAVIQENDGGEAVSP
jgi:hypothetical protein